MNNDITLESISPLYRSIPYTIPTIRLCLGTPNTQCLNLIISTITSYTIIGSKDSKCFINQYNHSASQTFDDRTIRLSLGFPLFEVKHYYFSGSIILDSIGFPNGGPLLNKFRLTHVEGKPGMPQLNADGFLGLRKVYEYGASSLLGHLTEIKAVERQTFSLYFNSNNTAEIAFGEDIQTITNHTCNTNNTSAFVQRNWFCMLDEIVIGDVVIKVNNTILQFASVLTSVIATRVEGKAVLDAVIALTGKKCYFRQENSHLMIICDMSLQVDQLHPVKVRMGNAELVLQWKHMMRLTKIEEKDCFVSLFIVNIDNNYSWSVGLPGFIDHSIVFDKDNYLIGIENNNQPQPKWSGSSFKRTVFTLMSIVLILGISLIAIMIGRYKIN